MAAVIGIWAGAIVIASLCAGNIDWTCKVRKNSYEDRNSEHNETEVR
jgi:hypothetical protein